MREAMPSGTWEETKRKALIALLNGPHKKEEVLLLYSEDDPYFPGMALFGWEFTPDNNGGNGKSMLSSLIITRYFSVITHEDGSLNLETINFFDQPLESLE